MYFFDYRLFDRVKRRQGYNPKYPDQLRFMKDLKSRLRLDFGICSDNKDPDKKGRVKVHFPHWGQNIISDWVPIIRPFGGTQFGLSTLPEVGDKLICMFVNADRSHPIVVGGVYNKGIAKPPFKMKEGNHIRAFTSRSGSKIVFNDEDGEEKIQIYMKDGKIRGTFSKSKGIALVNELGDIKVKCRKLTIEAGDAATIKFKKQLKITCKQDKLTMKSKKGIEFVSAKDIKFKGSKIKLKGMTAAMSKAVAKMGDQVVGVDIHQVNVPSPSGTVPTPLPHPYIGKLNDALSQDVVLDNKAVATKGSKSKHISPGHIPTPPGVSFTKGQPSEIGEVTNLTVPTVKVNNKEIAVLGSMVKTCNFPSDLETCTVVAVGAAIKIPIMMPGCDPDQFQRDGGMVVNTRDLVSQRDPNNPPPTPEITKAEWSGEKAFFGEELTLKTELKNQYENATVYKEIVFNDAEGNEKIIAKLSGTNKGGKSEVKFVAYPNMFQGYSTGASDELRIGYRVKSYKTGTLVSGILYLKYLLMKQLEMADAHFNFDSGVLLPGLSMNYQSDKDFGHDRQEWALEGVRMLQCCYRHIKQNSNQSLLVTGHTDRSGTFEYNVKLSRSRADSTLFALTGDKEEWGKDANKWYRVEDFICICKWINYNSHLGWSLPIERHRHLKGKKPVPQELVKSYQLEYNKLRKDISEDSDRKNKFQKGTLFDAELDDDGIMGPKTWSSVLDLYYYVIMLDSPDICSAESPADDLKTIQDSITFIADDAKSRGCGEYHPRFQADQDSVRASTNRRVEVMFFDGESKTRLANKLECKKGESFSNDVFERCKDSCAIYKEMKDSIRKESIKCRNLVEQRVLNLRLLKHQEPRKDLEYSLIYLIPNNSSTGNGAELIPINSTPLKGETDDEGKLQKHPIPYGASHIEVTVKYEEYDEEEDDDVERFDIYRMPIYYTLSPQEKELAYKLTNLGYQCRYIPTDLPVNNDKRLDKAITQFKVRNALDTDNASNIAVAAAAGSVSGGSYTPQHDRGEAKVEIDKVYKYEE